MSQSSSNPPSQTSLRDELESLSPEPDFSRARERVRPLHSAASEPDSFQELSFSRKRARDSHGEDDYGPAVAQTSQPRVIYELEMLISSTRQMESTVRQAQNRNRSLEQALAEEKHLLSSLSERHQALRAEAERKLRALGDRLRTSEADGLRLRTQTRQFAQTVKSLQLELQNAREATVFERKRFETDKGRAETSLKEERTKVEKLTAEIRKAQSKEALLTQEAERYRLRGEAVERDFTQLSARNRALEIRLTQTHSELEKTQARAKSLGADLIRFRAAWAELSSREKTARRMLADAQTKTQHLSSLLGKQEEGRVRQAATELELNQLRIQHETALKKESRARLEAEKARGELEQEYQRLRAEYTQSVSTASMERDRAFREKTRADEQIAELERRRLTLEQELVQERERAGALRASASSVGRGAFTPGASSAPKFPPRFVSAETPAGRVPVPPPFRKTGVLPGVPDEHASIGIEPLPEFIEKRLSSLPPDLSD